MNKNMFKLALDLLEPSDWAHFEILCSQFLLPEFSKLRTMAHPSGDGGRDSEIFCPEGKPFISAQYSVAKDWKSKIRKTRDRILGELPDVKYLIYLSNQQIGGQADPIKKELLDSGLSLDVRDKNWFLERSNIDEIRENASEELIDHIARPYLEGEKVINKPSSPLSTGEARAALLYLGLQWKDDISEKGLTKLSFDALVRSALRFTHSDNRLSRSQIYEFVEKTLPSANKAIIKQKSDSALTRLTKKYIRHWKKEDEFCLTHEEHQRINSRLADLESEEFNYKEALKEQCNLCIDEIELNGEFDIDDLLLRIPRVLEKLLLKRGENFVTAISTNTLYRISLMDLNDIILNDLSEHKTPKGKIEHLPKLISDIIRSLLGQPTIETQNYLKRLSNSYTLLSFLNEIPDVQSATKKLFSHGTIWVDTTVILPVFAEQLEEDISKRKFTSVFKACNQVGIELRIISGVLQEIQSHMHKSIKCSQCVVNMWQGRVPYLYYQYLNTGRDAKDFRKWISLFRGTERPDDDIAQFLLEEFDIKRYDLEKEAEKVDPDLLHAAQRLWTEAHYERRKDSQKVDEYSTDQLISNDVESYLGVISLRKTEPVTELGFQHWLLTLDRIAWKIRDKLREEFLSKTPPSPLLSLSFLVNNLTFGPIRGRINREKEIKLPVFLDIEMSESYSTDILKIADKVRKDNEGLPQYVIRRKVRDAIDKARRRHCHVGFSSLDDIDEEV